MKTNLTELKDVVVSKVLVETQALKWYVTLKLNFHKANDSAVITEPPVVFRTEVFTSVNVEDIDAMLHALYNELTQKIHDYQTNGSGWVVDQFIDDDLGEYNIDLLSILNDSLNFYFG